MNYSILKKIKQDITSKPPSWTFGRKDPKILIVAGIHGDEPTSIQTAMNLISNLDNYDINGTIKIFPIVNQYSFYARSRTSLDKKDLNRVFPGKTNGTISERLASYIWDEAINADFVLDLHCCGTYSSPYILSTYKQNPNSKEFVKKIGLDICVQSTGEEGQLFVECSKNGKPAAIIEIPGGGETGWTPSSMVEQISASIFQLLDKLDIIDYNTKDPIRPRFASKLKEISSPCDGIFSPISNAGDDLKKDDVIAKINDEIGIQMPLEGRLVFSSPEKFVFEGEVVGRYVNYID